MPLHKFRLVAKPNLAGGQSALSQYNRLMKPLPSLEGTKVNYQLSYYNVNVNALTT